MSIYYFCGSKLCEQLDLYVQEALEKYPESESVIRVWDIHVRDFFNSEYAKKFIVEQSNPLDVMPMPPYLEDFESKRDNFVAKTKLSDFDTDEEVTD